MSEVKDMLVVVLLVSICGLVQGLYRVDPLVSTNKGLIRGLRSDAGYAKFLGVPYAVVDKKNPFGPSVPHPGFDDIFEAYESNACPQIPDRSDEVIGIIDCLTMNIFVPNAATSQNRLPVMVWIHGGGFVTGSAKAEGDPGFLLRNDVVVVLINYRLGVYGFMCLDIPEVPGNQGLKDQLLALRWINENIEAFGGDASQITVFGESAGGMSVNLHLLSPSERLFQKAIIQSGPASMLIQESNKTIPIKLSEALDFETEDTLEALEYLASVDVHTLIQKAYDLKITSYTVPCIEKQIEGVESFITDHPMNVNTPKVRNTPVIIGNNNNEMPFLYESVDPDFFANYAYSLLSVAFDLEDDWEDAINDVRHFYIGDEQVDEKVADKMSDLGSDLRCNHPTQRMAERLLEIGARVYRYVFSYSGDRNLLKVLNNWNATGAIHADEIGYLFDNVDVFGDQITSEDQLMIDRFTTLWTNFAKYGDPTPSTSELLPVKWQPITKTTQPYLNLDSDLTLEGRPFNDRMAFWDLFYKLHKNQQKYEVSGK